MICPYCREEILEGAIKCKHCGSMLSPNSPQSSQNAPDLTPGSLDKLSAGWIAGIWCSLFIPYIGPWIVIVLSSIMYYVWKKSYPKKAKSINLHGWLAFILGNIVSFIILSLSKTN